MANDTDKNKMAGYLDNVAIIGAGLGGCALGLALSAKNVPTTIYESRPQVSGLIPSGVILTPNGLRVLDQLGVFERIEHRCYIPTARVYKNDKDETTKKIDTGGPEENGYWNHRIWRGLLLDEMRLMLKERGIPIHYNAKFGGIISENIEKGVKFHINSEIISASLLIGSDGIYSTVRKYLAPEIQPEYTGLVGVLAHIPWNSVKWPYPSYERNATIQGRPGAIFWIAEDPRPEPDIMTGIQIQYPEQSRSDLEDLQNNKDKLVEFYRRGYDDHGPTARSIIDAVSAHRETLYIWPFMKMPELSYWYSASGRVLLVGDGAHALPPSSGQGVNQALEDVYSLTLLLTSGAAKTDLLDALAFWQKMRQDRIDAVLDWTNNVTNVERMPEAERERLGKGRSTGQGHELGWLHQYDYDVVFDQWLAQKK